MAVHATSEVSIPAAGALLRGELTVPENAIGTVRAPTLLVLGGDDAAVIELNQAALANPRTWFVHWLGQAAAR
jgi:hypothetical protein